MNQARSITANDAVQAQPATYPGSGGDDHISGGSDGSYYDSGTILSLSADGTVAGPTSGSRYDFRNWTRDVASPPNANNPVSVTMNQARSITANYSASSTSSAWPPPRRQSAPATSPVRPTATGSTRARPST